jgi:protocatechuate 3,4-dioxygenase beta subunit
MSANVTTIVDQWWSDIPRPRKLLAFLCLLVSREEHPTFHWNGETGDVWVLNADGSRNYEMVPTPLADFRDVLQNLKENWSLYEEREIQLEIPLRSSAVSTRIRLEQLDLFPHLYIEIVDGGKDDERDEVLKQRFNDHLPFGDSKSKRITIRGKVLDHNGEPVSGVRLADRKSNWTESMMDDVQPGDLTSQVVFSDENGDYELCVELTPGIPDLDEVVVVYKAPSIDQWLRAEFDPADIEANPNDVTLQLQEPGKLNLSWNLSNVSFADCEHLQIGILRDRFYRVSDIEPKGELNLSGLVPGKYQVSIGMADSRQFLVHESVEVTDGKTVELRLDKYGNRKTTKTLHLKLSGLSTANDRPAEDFEFMLGAYPDVQLPWGPRGLEWSRKLSAMEPDSNGTYETKLDVTMIWQDSVRLYFYRNSNVVNSGEWNESTSNSIHHHCDCSQKVEYPISWSFEDGMKLEFQVEESVCEEAVSEAATDDSPDKIDELTQWWCQQSKQRQIFSRLLIAAIRQGLSEAYWELRTFTAYRDADNAVALLHRIGQTRFDVGFREFKDAGLSPGNAIVLEIPIGDESIAVDVSLIDQNDSSPMMKLSWQTVTDPAAIAALETVDESFPEDHEYYVIRGQVLDHQGQPVSGAIVFDAEEARQFTFTSSEGRDPFCGIGPETDEAGNFEVQMIQANEDLRNEKAGLVLAVQTDLVKGGCFKLDGPFCTADLEGIGIQLPPTTELVVQYDMTGVDDVVAPLKLHIESAEGNFWETVAIEATGETRFPNLTPGIWTISIHQFGNDLARQVVELTENESHAAKFVSVEKTTLQCEVVCSSKPKMNTTVNVRFESKCRSPYEPYREDEGENFDWLEQVEIEPDKFEEQNGHWTYAFRIPNLVGGIYELEISVDSVEQGDNAWSKYTSRSRSKELRIDGNSQQLKSVDLEWDLEEGQTIGLTVESC